MKYENSIQIVGKIVFPLEENHSYKGEKFYRTVVEVSRLSQNVDSLPVIISERILYGNDFKTGDVVLINGSIRSRHVETINGTRRLDVFIFAHEIDPFVGETEKNETELDCFIVRSSKCRVTPLTGRCLCDFLVAVGTNYIPCIAWERQSRFIETLDIGTHLKLKGRFQSRVYRKDLEDDSFEMRTVYEVSCSEIEVLESISDKKESEEK